MKSALVCGGCGLIGKAVIEEFRKTEWMLMIYDLKRNQDTMDAGSFLEALDNYRPNAVVNCTYPKNYIDHIASFLTVTYTVCEWLAKHGGGSMVNLGSIYGIVGSDYRIYEGQDVVKPPTLEYAAAKGAIIAMSRTAATIYGRHGVRVNVVSPGGVGDQQPEIFKENYSQKTVLGRMATPEDVAKAVFWLCSDETTYITGQNIVIDGGYTIK